MLGDTPEAEDAAQEAMLRAWRARESCRETAARMAWVGQIARREAFRLAQRQSGRREDFGVDLSQQEALDPLSGVEDRLLVDEALRSLSAIDRQLIGLRYGRDMTHSGVARATGLPEGTVKVRLHRARKRLATALVEPSR